MERVLITGASGFTGRYLIECLRRNMPHDTAYFGVDRVVQHGFEGVQTMVCDLTDPIAAYKLMEVSQPTRIYHLGGTFTNRMSEDYAGNVLTTKNLLSCIVNSRSLACKVLVVGSAAEYGSVSSEGKSVDETFPLKPISIYGLTKTFQTSLAQFYARVHGVRVVIARPFNLIGHGVSAQLFIGKLCEQILERKRGRIREITLGDISGARDYIDVFDAVYAYHRTLECGLQGEVYNVASGKLTPIRGLVERLFDLCGLGLENLRTEPGLYRPSDASPSFCGDISKLNRLGWAPKLAIDASIRMLANQIVSGSSGKSVPKVAKRMWT